MVGGDVIMEIYFMVEGLSKEVKGLMDNNLLIAVGI